MAKLDLADAFKHILVLPKDWLLLCSSWDSTQADGSVLRQYYVNLFLPFSLHSSPAIFNHFANTLEFAMWASSVNDLLHYLGDYFSAGPAGTGDCQHNINEMVEVCQEMGFAVNLSKVTSPSPITCFLGINIDSQEGVAHIDPKCLQAIILELSVFIRSSQPQSMRFSPLLVNCILFVGCVPWQSLPLADDRDLQEGITASS